MMILCVYISDIICMISNALTKSIMIMLRDCTCSCEVNHVHRAHVATRVHVTCTFRAYMVCLSLAMIFKDAKTLVTY